MSKSKTGPLTEPAWWWLPGDNEHQVPGVYRLNEDNRPFVETYAAISPGTDWIGSGRSVAILHGEAIGKKVTAVDLRATNERRTFSTKLAHSRFSPQYVVEGAHLSLDDLASAAVDVSFIDQEIWWDRKSVRVTKRHERNAFFAERLEYTKTPPEVAQLRDGKIIARDATIFHDSTPGIPHWTAGSEFEVRLDRPVPMKEIFTNWLGPLERLLTFSGREIAHAVYVNVQCESIEFEEPLEFRTVHTRWSATESRSEGRTLIDFLILSTDMDWSRQLPLWWDLVRNWDYGLDVLIDLFSDTRPRQPLAVLNTMCQVVESLDDYLNPVLQAEVDAHKRKIERVIGGMRQGGLPNSLVRWVRSGLKNLYRPSLERRIIRMHKSLGELAPSVENHAKWATAAAKIRNGVAHGSPMVNEYRVDVTHPQLLALYLQQVVDAAILLKLGFSEPEAAKILRRCHATGKRSSIIEDYRAEFN